MTSRELRLIQDSLIKSIRQELKQPAINFDVLREMINGLEKLDDLRRKTWNEEKFGKYEEIVDTVFNANDIPF